MSCIGGCFSFLVKLVGGIVSLVLGCACCLLGLVFLLVVGAVVGLIALIF